MSLISDIIAVIHDGKRFRDCNTRNNQQARAWCLDGGELERKWCLRVQISVPLISVILGILLGYRHGFWLRCYLGGYEEYSTALVFIGIGEIFRGTFGLDCSRICSSKLLVSLRWSSGQARLGYSVVALSFPDLPITLMIPLRQLCLSCRRNRWSIPGILEPTLGHLVIVTIMMNTLLTHVRNAFIHSFPKETIKYGFVYSY